MRPDGSAEDDDMSDAEMTPSNVSDGDTPKGVDPVGGDDPGDVQGSGVTPESGAWADQSPDGYGGKLEDGTGHVAGEDDR